MKKQKNFMAKVKKLLRVTKQRHCTIQKLLHRFDKIKNMRRVGNVSDEIAMEDLLQ